MTLSFVAAPLQLLGPKYRARTRQAALEIHEHLAHLIPNARDGWYHDLLAYEAELTDDSELLRRAGDSRFSQCEAYYVIGLRKLAEGRRKEAGSCFRAASDTHVFAWELCYWSRALMALVDDPDWLPWIPVTK